MPPPAATEILEYFVRNPRAADSLEGVARWLLRKTVHLRVEACDEAIGWLVAQGFLLQKSAAGAVPIFYLNEEKVADVEQFLAKAGGRRSTTTHPPRR